jgi:L-fuconolactonase
MRIDAHNHYWRIDRGDYGWITPAVPELYRDFGPEDLRPHLLKHGIAGTVVVQAAATLSETDYLLSLAESSSSVLGVVGWLDLADPAYREHYERFSRHPKFVGFRVMIQEMPNENAILEPSFVEAMRYFADKDVPVDLLVLSRQLEALVTLLRQVKGLRAVVDHIAKPPIADGIFQPWGERMREIAAIPGIYCKLSGMVTEADRLRWHPSDFTAYIRHTLQMFGPERVIFGSDWPVCLLAGSYDEVVGILENSLPDSWGVRETARLFGLNAKEFYKL